MKGYRPSNHPDAGIHFANLSHPQHYKPRQKTGRLTTTQLEFCRVNCRRNGGKYTFAEIAKMFGVDPSTISKAMRQP